MKAIKTALILYVGIISTIVLSTAIFAFFTIGISGTGINEVLRILLGGLGIYAIFDYVRNRFKINHRLLLLWWFPQIVYFSNTYYDLASKTSSTDSVLSAVMVFNLSFIMAMENMDGGYFQLHINFLAIAVLIVIYKLMANESSIRDSELILPEEYPSLPAKSSSEE